MLLGDALPNLWAHRTMDILALYNLLVYRMWNLIRMLFAQTLRAQSNCVVVRDVPGKEDRYTASPGTIAWVKPKFHPHPETAAKKPTS